MGFEFRSSRSLGRLGVSPPPLPTALSHLWPVNPCFEDDGSSHRSIRVVSSSAKPITIPISEFRLLGGLRRESEKKCHIYGSPAPSVFEDII